MQNGEKTMEIAKVERISPNKEKVIFSDGSFHIKYMGLLHSLDEPALVEKGKIGYYVKGKLHNPNGPALIIEEGDRKEEHFFWGGMRHNPNGPAVIIYKNGEVVEKLFYIKGKLHNLNGPAHITPVFEKWYVNDLLHNEKDEPAYINKESKGRWFYKCGVLHREGDKPAVELADGLRAHYNKGVLHRDGDKPAKYNVNTGFELYVKNGIRFREGDKPFLIDPVEGKLIWGDDKGDRHREGDEPAYVNTLTGEKIYYKHGKKHRDGDLPAYDSPTVKRYYKNGLLSRYGKPAVISPDGLQYFENGVEVIPEG